MPGNHSLSAEHRRHDRLLVARFVADDAAFGQDHEARNLVHRCRECAALAADISTISGAVARLPAPPRPRDFRLTAEQAADLRGSRVNRWLRAVTSSSWSTVRPVAAVALSIGMVMSVVGMLPILGAAGSAPLLPMGGEVAADQPSPAQTTADRGGVMGPEGTLGEPVGAPTPVDPDEGSQAGNAGVAQPPADLNINGAYVQPTPAAEPQPDSSEDLQKSLPGTSSGLGSALLLSGLAVSLLALAVLVLLYAARRRVYDPLLR